MSLALYSEDGWVTNLGSAGAVSLLANTVYSRTGLIALDSFLSNGACTDPSDVITDLNELIPTITDKDVKGLAESLKDGLDKIKDKEVAIIA